MGGGGQQVALLLKGAVEGGVRAIRTWNNDGHIGRF
jgi:hypothetical protein